MTQLHKQPHTAGLTNGDLKPSISGAIPAALLRASPNAALVIGMGHTAGTCIQGRDTLRDFRQEYLRQNLSCFERKEDTWPATMQQNRKRCLICPSGGACAAHTQPASPTGSCRAVGTHEVLLDGQEQCGVHTHVVGAQREKGFLHQAAATGLCSKKK